MKNFVKKMSLFVFILLILVLSTSFVSSAAIPIAGKIYYIKAVHSGKYLTAPFSQSITQQYPFDGSPSI